MWQYSSTSYNVCFTETVHLTLPAALAAVYSSCPIVYVCLYDCTRTLEQNDLRPRYLA